MLDVSELQKSFTILQPRLHELADRFYETLWTEFPKAKALFTTTEMDKQKAGFIQGLEFIVAHLGQPEILRPYLSAMGIRHSCYGIKAQHYEWINVCLTRSLASCYGRAWNDAVADGWKQAIDLALGVMRAGADEVRMRAS